MDKNQLISMFREVFKNWEAELAKLSEETINTPGLIEHERSIKDVIAHLTGWQQVSVARMEAARDHRDPDYPQWSPELDLVHETNVDAANAWLYKTYRHKTWTEVHNEWLERFRYLLKLSESIPEEELFVPGVPAWRGEYRLSAVLEGSHEHHQEHLDALRAWLDRQKS